MIPFTKLSHYIRKASILVPIILTSNSLKGVKFAIITHLPQVKTRSGRHKVRKCICGSANRAIYLYPHIPHNPSNSHTLNKAKPLAEYSYLLPSTPALGYLCTTQALKPCAGKSSWGMASNLWELTLSSTTTPTLLGQLGIC